MDRLIEQTLGAPVRRLNRVGGGDICEAWEAESGGQRLFVKLAPPGSSAMFEAESAGLRALQAAGGCRIPEILAVGPQVLVLEWIERGTGHAARGAMPESLGRGLAIQHQTTREAAGFEGTNYLGTTVQPNPWSPDWVAFFAEHRLGHQQALLRAAGRCPTTLDHQLDRLIDQLDRWLDPEEPAALLHGDLWTGNAMPDTSGRAVLYDPAAYFGAREADLAMTELFGSFGAGFWDAYHEIHPRQPGYSERRALYNLYHVLNHANLFGGGYIAQATAMVRELV